MLLLYLVSLASACRPDWHVYTAPSREFRLLMPGDPSEEVAEGGPDGFSAFHWYIAIPFASPSVAASSPSWSRNLRVLWTVAHSRLSNRHATYLVGVGELTSPNDAVGDTLRRYREYVLSLPGSPTDTDAANAWTCRRIALRETSLELEGHPGLEIVFDEVCRDDEAEEPVVFRYRTRAYEVDAKLFVLEVMSSPGAVKEGETPVAQRFFDSFEVL